MNSFDKITDRDRLIQVVTVGAYECRRTVENLVEHIRLVDIRRRGTRGRLKARKPMNVVLTFSDGFNYDRLILLFFARSEIGGSLEVQFMFG